MRTFIKCSLKWQYFFLLLYVICILIHLHTQWFHTSYATLWKQWWVHSSRPGHGHSKHFCHQEAYYRSLDIHRPFLTGTGYTHYDDVIIGAMASQITSLAIVYSTVYSGAGQSKHQSSESLAFVWGIHRWPVNSPHKWHVTRKMFPFDDVIIC